ncbi:hypothetical protein FKP32DRAFT_1560221 [Trametes sanguinea]|nr:hypothetical protein FKP32DRAFT_1560221 [Trametes sanguinea]
MQIKVEGTGGVLITRTVKRRQFPITAAYAFTDYRSQGQTIPRVIVDIKQPPGPKRLTLFNLYVALSRSIAEDARLDEWDATTKTWWQKMNRPRMSEQEVRRTVN